MPSANGHSPKRVILYARVSSLEQARSGYSLAQQLEALREYAASEGYEVLEGVADPGQSGASLERPGMDHVRDLVAAGGVSVVLALDRDRLARKVVLNLVLEEELARHGCELRALNDYAGDSPEAALMRGIQGQFAEYERAKIVERTRRGKERKAREGRIMRGPKAPYGFRYNASCDALIVHEPEMVVVEKAFGMAASGLGPGAIQTRLHAEGVPSPTGKRMWQRQVLKRMVENDIYLPHTYDEVREVVRPEVAARLDPELGYGLWWYGRHEVTVQAVSGPDGNGGKRYAKREVRKPRPREEQIAVPVPAYLPRGLVEGARATLAANKGSERKYLAREWELRGSVRCSCGGRMGTQTTKPRGGETTYHYYACNRRRQLRKMCECTQRSLSATEVEGRVWRFVSGLLKDPEKVRIGMNRLIEQELSERGGDPQREAEAWTEKITECDRSRSAYQDQQAAGLMTLDELGCKLKELESTRELARSELGQLQRRRERADDLERDRDAVVESYAGMLPEALDALSGEERRRLYGMLRLEVAPAPDGLEVSGALSTSEPRRTAM
jgi:site-specific DNA recombinase